MSVVKIYACGGAGINLGKQFASWSGRSTGQYAQLDTVFIDTSKSNLDPEIPREQIYLVNDLDGSGKLRATNFAAISEAANEILHEHRPADINVVLHSAGGGSGSVIGPLLVSELLDRGQQVIVVMVGSTSSRIETENTKKTLMGYEAISLKRNRPVNCFYRQNSLETPRAQIDKSVSAVLTLMTMVFSGSIRELDSEDIRNFLNYQNVTSYTPKLTFLDFWNQEIDLQKGESVVSVVTLVDDNTNPGIAQMTDYQAVGYMSADFAKIVPQPLPLHMAVIAGHFRPVIDNLTKLLGEHKETRSTINDKTIVEAGSNTTDQGLIL